MIAELIEDAYDFEGRRTALPVRHSHRCFHPTFPMGRHLSQPLAAICRDLEEVRQFLISCRYASDEQLFGREDYWQPPEDFERRRAGDCEDFALWTWRQLLALGYEARLVIGRAGRYGEGHAWLTLELKGRQCLLEPLLAAVGPRLPRLSALRYQPEVSVGWDGKRPMYFKHDQRTFNPPVGRRLVLVWEWLSFWTGFWLRTLGRLTLRVGKLIPAQVLRRLRRTR